MILHFMAAASLSQTFWQEVDMMIESNEVPPYLQDALTHATFEQLDLDHDGVATQPEMQEYLAKLTADSADMLEAVKDIPMKYPVFQVTSTMSPEAKDTVCMMALAYEEIDFDSALEKYTSDNVFAESVESFFETAPMSVDYDVWHGIGQREFLPQVYSDELVIPDECLSVRRKLLGPAAIAGAFGVGVVASWAIWEVFALSVAALGAATETLLVECLDQHWHWDPSKENCNWGHWSKATVLALLGEHAIVAAPYAFTAIFGMTPEVAAAGGTGIRIAGRTIGVPSGLTEAFIPPALVAGGHNAFVDCPAIQTNVDYPGNDLNAGGLFGRVPGLRTQEQCADWCKSDSRCVGYTFVKSEPYRDNCAVKASWNEGSRRAGSSCCDSQKITRGCTESVAVTACPAVQSNVDFPGNDLNAGGMWGRVPGHLTRDQCAAWCKSDSRCVGYTFVKSQTSGDNCAVKSSWNEASRRPGSSCCDSQQITRGCISVTACPAVQTNVDYPGNDLNAGGMWGRVPGHLTRDQCAAWCKADARCAGYTFVKSQTSGDNCAVKSSWVEGSRRAGSSCCDSQQITRGVLSGCV